MTGAGTVSSVDRAPMRRSWLLLGFVTLAIGLGLHLVSARAIGGTYTAYRDHIFGFVLLTVVSGAIIAGLGWRFWKGRHDITLLILGALQLVLGYFVYLGRYGVHG